MAISIEILGPVLALVVWTLAMMVWLYATRLPAMRRAGVPMTGRIDSKSGSLDGMIDERAQWKAHNYNHLTEQPTLFYAVAISLALLGEGNGFPLLMAWSYVALRIAHSFVQATVNVVQWRFLLFIAASLALAGMTIAAVAAVIGRAA